MTTQLKAFFKPPAYEDPEQQRRARLLYMILLFNGAFIVVLLLGFFIGGVANSDNIPPAAVSFLVYTALFILLQRGYIRLSSVLFVLLGWLIGTTVTYFYGGISTSYIFLYIQTLIIAGVLLDQKMTLGMIALMLLSALGLYSAEQYGFVPEGIESLPITPLVILATSVIVSGVILLFSNQSYQQALEQARNAETRLQALNEELEQLDHMKDSFISSVTHELRTPLTVLKLNHHILTVNNDNKKALHNLIQGINRLEAIVEEMFFVSQMQQESHRIKLVSVDFADIVDQMIVFCSSIAADRNIKLLLADYPDLPLIIGDPIGLERVVKALLDNALNYSPAGGAVHVDLGIEQRANVAGIFLRVADSGPGISDQEASKIYERFYRGEIALHAGVPGAGLGLFIARAIVEQHRGKIEVSHRPAPEQGAIFTVWLPAEV